MATGWSVLDALNNETKKTAEADRAAGRFRTKDIAIGKLYSNSMNFYSMQDIEKLAQDILLCGLMENLTVTYAPSDKGEYRIVAGERRWRALTLLKEKGYEEYEYATCRIVQPESSREECIQLIIANDYRSKTIIDVMEEEKQLKETLQEMKENGEKLKGYDIESGRLRDVIAQIMRTSSTKIAQIENINNNLIPEFMEEVKAGRLTFSAAYELSGMDPEAQQELIERRNETPLTWKDIREEKDKIKNEKREADPEEEQEGSEADPAEAADALTKVWNLIKDTYIGRDPDDMTKAETMTTLHSFGLQHRSTMQRGVEITMSPMKIEYGLEDGELTEETWTAFLNHVREAGLWNPKTVIDDAHPEVEHSICYSCANYDICTERSEDVRDCDRFVDRKQAQKTDEDMYDEEQERIDKETRKKLQAEEDRLAQNPKEPIRRQRTITVSETMMKNIESAAVPYMILKDRDDEEPITQNEIIKLIGYKNGEPTGKTLDVVVTCVDTAYTSSGIVEGYSIVGMMEKYDAEACGLIDLEDDD